MKLILVSYKKIHFMHKVDNSGYYPHSRAGCAALPFTKCNIYGRACA